MRGAAGGWRGVWRAGEGEKGEKRWGKRKTFPSSETSFPISIEIVERQDEHKPRREGKGRRRKKKKNN